MAPVAKQLALSGLFDVQVCITAQHREMLDQALALFKIKPKYDLDIMKPGQDLTDITVASLKGVGDVLRQSSPDMVLVHGDTTTTFSASLAAFYQKIPVGHVEAGLRTWDQYSPWPEEMNRRMTSAIASLHFAPTQKAKENLLREGISPASVFVTGNTVVDALLETSEVIETDKSIGESLAKEFSFIAPDKKLILVTGHRRENFGEGFENICHALQALAERDDIQIVYPVHLNPNVQEPVRRLLGNRKRIHLVAPVPYLQFVYLLKRAYIILTDSGGVHEEAPTFDKPVLLLRAITERPEALHAGTVRLVGTDKGKILQEATRLLESRSEYEQMVRKENPYGDGLAAKRIAEIMAERWKDKGRDAK